MTIKALKNVVLDDTDNKIILVLKEDSKQPYRMIAKKLLMPVTTVHHRIMKLEKEGVIKKYTIKLNNKAIGNDVCAYLLIKVDYNSLTRKGITQQQLALKLKHRIEVEDVALITGLRDIIIKIRTKSVEELNQLVTKDLRNIVGVRSTETMLILDELEY